jgi:molybdopterin molybdotransferase
MNPISAGGGDSRSFLSVDAARTAILGALTPIAGRERVAVRAALGRVLAEDVIAPYNVPAHDNSAMDGYALRAQDLAADGETALVVVGTAFAGRPFSGMVGPGQALRIMTGATIPQGADTIVVQEVARREHDRVFIPAGQKKGQNLRRAGEDLAEGGIALAAGKRCGPAELGLIASLGIAEVCVRRKLRVAVMSTGDEIASIGRPLGPGEVYDSNRYTLHGVLTRLGCELLDLGVVADRPDALEEAFREAAQAADVIITSGGVSVGEADFIREMMARMGEVAFWKLAIKPGRPMAFGRIGNAVLFGLPGNPVAVMVTFYQFVQDALLALMGVAPLPPAERFAARAAFSMRKQPGRVEYLRGRLQRDADGVAVALAGAQGSGVLSSMSEADCFVVLAEDCTAVRAGDTVFVQPFHGLV